jgi:hypothetical protein
MPNLSVRNSADPFREKTGTISARPNNARQNANSPALKSAERWRTIITINIKATAASRHQIMPRTLAGRAANQGRTGLLIPRTP